MPEVKLKSKVMQKNDEIAAVSRERFKKADIFCVNLIGSPGSGKTTLLEAAFRSTPDRARCAVIEGDVKTENDMNRILAAGVPAVQIQTDGACHLNAEQVAGMLDRLPLDEARVLIIENVGNLICPVSYDLGEESRLIVISVAEGQDKPLKYPSAFMSAQVMVVTTADLAPHVDVDIDGLIANARSINPKLEVLVTSARTGQGIDAFSKFLFDRPRR